jgi:hypothetical protein
MLTFVVIKAKGITQSSSEEGVLPEKAGRSCFHVLVEILHQRVIWKHENVVRSLLKASESIRSWSSHHFEIEKRFLREVLIIACDNVALTLKDLDYVLRLTSQFSASQR